MKLKFHIYWALSLDFRSEWPFHLSFGQPGLGFILIKQILVQSYWLGSKGLDCSVWNNLRRQCQNTTSNDQAYPTADPALGPFLLCQFMLPKTEVIASYGSFWALLGPKYLGLGHISVGIPCLLQLWNCTLGRGQNLLRVGSYWFVICTDILCMNYCPFSISLEAVNT